MSTLKPYLNKLSKRQRKTIAALVLFNCLALFVNYFNVSPSIKFETSSNKYEIFMFTDFFGEEQHFTDVTSLNREVRRLHSSHDTEHFYPFTNFIKTESTRLIHASKVFRRFRGVFPDYDFSEFIVYNLLILIFILYNKHKQQL